MLLYLIWAFLIGSFTLMIGVMVYNEWFAPQTEGAATIESAASSSDAAFTAPMAASAFAPEPLAPSRGRASKSRKPAARKPAKKKKR